ncbi:MAG: hypothetical protein FJ098_16750 [Deltaproteobacteria bacterium]|nr:hypothetical protein [Deltaproteobacteria bacterium]
MRRWLPVVVLLGLAASCRTEQEPAEPGLRVVQTGAAPAGGKPPAAASAAAPRAPDPLPPETAPSAPETRAGEATPSEPVPAPEAEATATPSEPVPAPETEATAPLTERPGTDEAPPSHIPRPTPDSLPGASPQDPETHIHDVEIRKAVALGLHDPGEGPAAPAPQEEPVIHLDEKGRITGVAPDMAPKLPFLFEGDELTCPGDAELQGARPPEGRKLACRTDGRLVGPFIEWFDNGQRRAERSYVEGVKQGPVRYWYRDGALKALRFFEDGRAEGRYARWHANGRKAEEGAYEKSLQVGPWTAWYPSGRKESEGMFVLGRREGPWLYWHPNGEKKIEGSYRKGQRWGTWTWWHQNGQLEKRGEYVNDIPAHRLVIYDDTGRVLQE